MVSSGSPYRAKILTYKDDIPCVEHSSISKLIYHGSRFPDFFALWSCKSELPIDTKLESFWCWVLLLWIPYYGFIRYGIEAYGKKKEILIINGTKSKGNLFRRWMPWRLIFAVWEATKTWIATQINRLKLHKIGGCISMIWNGIIMQHKKLESLKCHFLKKHTHSTKRCFLVRNSHPKTSF